ncbi:MAG: hypothetical protein LBK01_03925 [Burkholderiaceae bacterium]|nr:hypothetical protein [Burkholderiaceae bacterium]
MREKLFSFGVLGLVCCLSFTGIAHAENAAKALSVVPGASLTRNGQTPPLERFSPLHRADTVNTGAAGRVRLADDSTVDPGANSRFRGMCGEAAVGLCSPRMRG